MYNLLQAFEARKSLFTGGRVAVSKTVVTVTSHKVTVM
jgi:hypothetical protein